MKLKKKKEITRKILVKVGMKRKKALNKNSENQSLKNTVGEYELVSGIAYASK